MNQLLADVGKTLIKTGAQEVRSGIEKFGKDIVKGGKKLLRQTTGIKAGEIEQFFSGQATLGSSLNARNVIGGVATQDLARMIAQSYAVFDGKPKSNLDNISGFIRLPTLGNGDYQIYQNPTNNIVVVAFRGTRTSVRDITADINFVFGTEEASSRIKEARDFVKSFMNTQLFRGATKVVFTGHSLGGMTAFYGFNDARKVSPQAVKFIAFNGAVPPGLFSALPKGANKQMRTINDPVSLKTPFGKNVMVYDCPFGNSPSKSMVCHGLKGVWFTPGVSREVQLQPVEGSDNLTQESMGSQEVSQPDEAFLQV